MACHLEQVKLIVIAGLLVAGTAYADDVAERCTRGVAHANKGDLPRAHLYLLGCTEAALPAEIASTVAKAARELKRKLRDSELSSIAIAVEPDGVSLTAQITALPGEQFAVPATIWVKAGTYELTATNGEVTWKQPVTVGAFSRTSAVVRTDTSRKKAIEPKTGQVSFDEGGDIEQTQGSPPPVKRGSLMSKRYRGVVEGPAGDLVDPLAYRPARWTTRPLWLGFRLGGGMFDDSTGDARAGAAVAATLRYRFTPRYFIAGRLDWSRRSSASIDVLGASAGAGANLTPSIAFLAQLRGDLRLGDEMGVSTLGASGALGLEVALPSTPITAGVRFEQGITAIAGDTRDRALLLEIGADWR